MKQFRRVLLVGVIIGLMGAGSSIAQWIEVSRPEEWKINDLVVEGANVFAATNRGVFRSEDDGETWLAASAGLDNSNVNSIVATGKSLLVGTVEGAYRSTNSGGSWTEVNTGLARGMPMDVVWPAVSVGDELFFGTSEGVFKSDDGGESWTTVNFGLPEYQYIDGLAVIGSVVFAMTSDGLYRTVDRGLEWVRVDLGVPALGGFETMAQLGEVLFVGTDRGIYKSTDRGASWSKIEIDARANQLWSLSAGESKLCAQYEYVLFVISQQGGRWVAERSSNLELQCASDGASLEGPLVDAYRTGFEQLISSAASRTVFDRGMIDDSLEELYAIGGHLYADTGDGLFRSIDDGETWEALDAELPRTLTVNAFFTNETGIFAGTAYGVYLSRNNGQSWTLTSPGEIEIFDFAARGPSLYAGTEDGVYVTQDDGDTWSKTNLVLRRFTDVTSVAVPGAAIVADTDDGSFVSRDDGATWVEIEADQLDGFRWDEMEVIGRDLFFGGFWGVFRSSDLGSTWVDVSNGLPEDGRASNLTVIGDQLFLISSDGRVFKTGDRGATWRATAALPSFVHPDMLAAVGGDLLADTSEGIFLSADGGDRWTALDSGPLWQVARAFSKAGPNLIAGTGSAGVFVHKAGSETWGPSSEGLPRYSNWPGEGFVWAGKYLFVGTSDGVYRSVDFGRTWNPDTSLKADGPYVLSLAVVGDDVLMGTTSSTFKSTDDGETWEPMQPELTYWTGIENLRLVGSTLFADVDKCGTFFLTRDGDDWIRMGDDDDDEDVGEPPSNLDGMTALAVFGDTVFARRTDRPGLFVSAESGNGWTTADTGLPAPIEVISISMYWKDLHARTVDEHFISTDGGKSWVGIGSGPPDGTIIWDYSISETHVFARSGDGEVWRRTRVGSHQPER